MTDIAAEPLANEPAAGHAKAAGEVAALPRRDLIILPLLSLMTLAVLLVFSEVGARLYMPEQIYDACRAGGAAPGETHNLPNCHTKLKLPEGPMADYSYNECGYRTDAPCGPKPAGVKRIALIGSSMAQGYGVAYDQSFATRAGRALAEMCRTPVQMENMGTVGNSILGMHHQMGEALGLNPDLVIMLVAPFDVWSLSDFPAAQNVAVGPAAPTVPAPATDPPNFLHRAEIALKSSRAMFVTQHFLFQNASFYVKAYLLYGDKADFLRPPFTPAWNERFAQFETLVGDMANQAHRAGVPFALLVGPQQAQAVLLSMKHVPPGVDPRAFGRRIGEIARRHGIIVVNSTDAFSHVKNADQDFFTVDGHPDVEGNAVIADATVQGLVRGPAAPFASCAAPRSAEK